MHEVVEGFVVVGAHAQGGVVHEREGRCDTQVCESVTRTQLQRMPAQAAHSLLDCLLPLVDALVRVTHALVSLR
jgi:hypothetical protein